MPQHPLDEQRRIADFLDDRVARIDQIIAARRQQLLDTREAARALVSSAVRRQDDALVPCRAKVDIRLGRQRSPQHEQGDHMMPYLRSANITDGRVLLDGVKRMNFSPQEQRVFALAYGDVLVTEGSASPEAVGAAAAWRGELSGTVCFQNTLLRLRPKQGYDPDFLEVWARAAHYAKAPQAFASGASILHLGAEGMGRIPIPLIDEHEQGRRTDRAREALRASGLGERLIAHSIDLLTEYKSSLITAAVTGELDVTTASRRIPGE